MHVLDAQCRVTANMWAILTLVFCAVYPALTIILHQDTGSLHIHKKPNAPLHEETPLQPEDVEATKIAGDFLKSLLPTLDTRIEKSVKSIILHELNAVFTLALYDFVLKGLRHATLDNLVVRMTNSRVDFNASIPFLSAAATVFVNGMIDDTNFAIVGNLSTFSEDVKITGILDIQKLQLPSQLYVLQITDADIKIDLSNILIEFKLVEELVAFKMILVEFMNKPVDDIVKSVSRAAVRLVNEQLAKIPAHTIINFLVPPKAAAVPSVQGRSSNLRASNYPNYRYGYN